MSPKLLEKRLVKDFPDTVFLVKLWDTYSAGEVLIRHRLSLSGALWTSGVAISPYDSYQAIAQKVAAELPNLLTHS